MENLKSAFARLAGPLGTDLALFCLCAAEDVRYQPETGAESWDEYLEMMGPEPGEFLDGETDVNAAILAGMDTSERWKIVWGEDYSENEYKRLDHLYSTMTAQLDAAGGFIDKQQEDTARYCSRLALEREKLTRNPDKDNVAMAKNLDDMIRKNLQDCNMRKADILPSQKQRPDGFVDALRKKLGLSVEMTYDDVMQAFYAWCRKKKYGITADAMEHCLLSILNTMAKNDDRPEISDLPEDMGLAAFESEFAEEPNDQEIETYRYMGLVRQRRNRGDAG